VRRQHWRRGHIRRAPASGRFARHRRLRDPHGDFGHNILAAHHATQPQADRINALAFDANITTYVQMAAYHAVIAAYATGHPDPALPYWPMAFKNLTARFLSNDDFPEAANQQAATGLTAALAAGRPALPDRGPLPPRTHRRSPPDGRPRPRRRGRTRRPRPLADTRMSILATGTTGTVSTALLHSLATIEHPPVRPSPETRQGTRPTRASGRTSRTLANPTRSHAHNIPFRVGVAGRPGIWTAAPNGGSARSLVEDSTTVSDQEVLSIVGDQHAHAWLRCNWVFVIVYASAMALKPTARNSVTGTIKAACQVDGSCHSEPFHPSISWVWRTWMAWRAAWPARGSSGVCAGCARS
jgi:hypothetical protein